MELWRTEFLKGKLWLSHHHPYQALKCFSDALRLCPASNCGCSSRLVFYMGIALKQLGYFSSAIKLWISANRIRKNRLIKKMIERYTNGYGMPRQETEELDDRNAFFSTQIKRYLDKKHNKKFSTSAEQDVVFELVKDYWNSLKENGLLEGKSISEKRDIFHRVTIAFPYFYMPKCIGDSIVKVNFKNNENMEDAPRCFCGSGLPFSMCCGRTPAIEEVVNGNY